MRTEHEPHLSAGRGWDEVPEPANLKERGNRPDTGGQIREPVEDFRYDVEKLRTAPGHNAGKR